MSIRFSPYAVPISTGHWLFNIFAKVGYSQLLRPQNEQNKYIREALIRLNTLEIQTAYPFLLLAYDAYEASQIGLEDLLDLFKVLENYTVRRYVCGEPTNYLNTIFPTIWHEITTEISNGLTFKEALRKVLLAKGYPSNRIVQQCIRTAKLYDKRSRAKIVLILETINRYLSRNAGGYTVLDDEPTIEHILPQTPSENWKTSLGEKLEQTYQDYLHTLGNLTLVTKEWNSTLSNAPFSEKKQILGNHALKINSEYFCQNPELWNEQSIIERADFLAQNFIKIWSAIGEAVAIVTPSYGKPKAITICGSIIILPDKTWRQLLKSILDWIVKNRLRRLSEIIVRPCVVGSVVLHGLSLLTV